MAEPTTYDIRALECAQNRAIVLQDDTLFYGTGYKMLRSLNLDCLATCARARCNGRVQLVYFTRNYVPLLRFSHGAGRASVARVLKNLVDAMLELRRNGFLSDRNVLLDIDSVYIDPSTESVKLLYVPLTHPVCGGNDVEVGRRVFDTCQAALAEGGGDVMLSGSAAYEWGKLETLREELDRLAGSHAGRHARTGAGMPREKHASADVEYMLATQVGGRSVNMRVSGARTVLGKSAARADCVVGMSTAISRVHCALSIKRDGSLSVTDLGSRNGTWADGVRVDAHEERPLSDGSTLKLADVVFTVTRVGA